MTKQVEILFKKVASLSEEMQDYLAKVWNEDIESELNFDDKISATSKKLDKLAEKALNDFKANKTIEIGFDEL